MVTTKTVLWAVRQTVRRAMQQTAVIALLFKAIVILPLTFQGRPIFQGRLFAMTRKLLSAAAHQCPSY